VEPHSTFYSGDVYAYMERELEWEMSRHGAPGFIHAVVNGTHGDNSPDVAKQDSGVAPPRHRPGKKSIELFNSLGRELRAT